MKRSERHGFDLLLYAAAFAARKHRVQRRKDAAATPYINHPLAVARALAEEGGVTDAEVLAAALLHDTIEDTDTRYDELRGQFGTRIADLVAEVTDTKFLGKKTRKRLQHARARRASAAACQIKVADKLCNLRDILAMPPADWTRARKREYFDWAKAVVDRVRGANPRLERRFDGLYMAARRVLDRLAAGPGTANAARAAPSPIDQGLTCGSTAASGTRYHKRKRYESPIAAVPPPASRDA